MTNSAKIPVLIVLGSGGHTTEMLHLTNALNRDRYWPRCFVFASTDSMSPQKLDAIKEEAECDRFKIPRAREVGQMWLTAFFYTIFAFFVSLPMVLKKRPKLLLVNGPGTCLPVVLATWLCSKLRLIPSTKIIFVESICRVETLSLSAKMLWYVLDEIIVQWPELALKYEGQVSYIGKIA